MRRTASGLLAVTLAACASRGPAPIHTPPIAPTASAIARIAGCYRADIGPWENTGQPPGMNPFPVFRLDTAPHDWGWQQAFPSVRNMWGGPGKWKLLEADSILVIWGTDYSMGGYRLLVAGDSLRGVAITWGDVRTDFRDPTAPVTGVRTTCPAELALLAPYVWPTLVFLDGVKRIDLRPIGPYPASRRDYPPLDQLAFVQSLIAWNDDKRYGLPGNALVQFVWTKAYIANGGALSTDYANTRLAGRDSATAAEEMARRIAARLLAGVRLDSKHTAAAMDVIRRDVTAGERVEGRACEVWRRAISMRSERDRALRDLLTSSADLATFERHSQDERIPAQMHGCRTNGSADVETMEQIELEAARAVHPYLPRVEAKFDARADHRGHMQEPRRREHEERLSFLLAAFLSDGRAASACSGTGPSTCRLIGTQALVAMSAPQVTGDSASVMVRITSATGSTRQPVAERDVEVILVKRDGRWEFAKFGEMRAT
jgi:hypothetical protein